MSAETGHRRYRRCEGGAQDGSASWNGIEVFRDVSKQYSAYLELSPVISRSSGCGSCAVEVVPRPRMTRSLWPRFPRRTIGRRRFPGTCSPTTRSMCKKFRHLAKTHDRLESYLPAAAVHSVEVVDDVWRTNTNLETTTPTHGPEECRRD